MTNNKVAWSVVTLIAAGLATYMLVKRRRGDKDEPAANPHERHLTNVFAKAKNHGGGEYVL